MIRGGSVALVALVALAGLPGGAAALDLALPVPGSPVAEDTTPMAQIDLPTGAAEGREVPVRRVEGAVERQAWHVDLDGLSVPQLAALLRDGLVEEGFDILYDCADRACGGFDFRYAMELLPEPQMHVDLGNFRYVLAGRGEALVALVVSRGGARGYLHLTSIGPAVLTAPAPVAAAPVPAAPAPAAEAGPSASPTDMAGALADTGHAALDDLAFESGASELSARAFPSLAELAAWLRADPARQVALVGHTDAVGGLEPNIALSRSRAEAVRRRLIEAHGVAEGQVSASGIGFLAPRASNATEAGRALNRRVEVVVTAGG